MPIAKGIKTGLTIALGFFSSIGITKLWDANHYDAEGFNGLGRNREGFDRDGYNVNGFDRDGYNRQGFDKNGYDHDGYDANGFDRRGRDREGYDRRGYDRNGYDRYGLDREGYASDGFNSSGKDRSAAIRKHYDFIVEDMNEYLQKAWAFKDSHDYESAVTPARKALECGIRNIQYHWFGKPDRLPIMHDQIEKCERCLGREMCGKLESAWRITSDSSHYHDEAVKPLTDEQVHFCLKTIEELRDVVALYGTRNS